MPHGAHSPPFFSLFAFLLARGDISMKASSKYFFKVHFIIDSTSNLSFFDHLTFHFSITGFTKCISASTTLALLVTISPRHTCQSGVQRTSDTHSHPEMNLITPPLYNIHDVLLLSVCYIGKYTWKYQAWQHSQSEWYPLCYPACSKTVLDGVRG